MEFVQTEFKSIMTKLENHILEDTRFLYHFRSMRLCNCGSPDMAPMRKLLLWSIFVKFCIYLRIEIPRKNCIKFTNRANELALKKALNNFTSLL